MSDLSSFAVSGSGHKKAPMDKTSSMGAFNSRFKGRVGNGAGFTSFHPFHPFRPFREVHRHRAWLPVYLRVFRQPLPG